MRKLRVLLVMAVSLVLVGATASANSVPVIDGVITPDEWDGYYLGTSVTAWQGGMSVDVYGFADDTNVYAAYVADMTEPGWGVAAGLCVSANLDYQTPQTASWPDPGYTHISVYGDGFAQTYGIGWQWPDGWGNTDPTVFTSRGIEYYVGEPCYSSPYPNTAEIKIPLSLLSYAGADDQIALGGQYWQYDWATAFYVALGLPDTEGPVTAGVMAVPNPVAAAQLVHVTATVDDSTTGGSNVASASYALYDSLGSEVLSGDMQDSFDSPMVSAWADFTAPGDAGIYDLCVWGTDEPGNTGPQECIMLVVYDPDGGFVTGGGWIDSPAGASPPVWMATYLNGFEANTSGWFGWGGSITRVPSGTNGVASADGSWHAEVVVGPANGDGAFTRFGGYSSVFPPGGLSQLVDVYIDPAMGQIGQGWALDNALNGSDGVWEEAGGVGALKANDGYWWLAADGDGAGYPGTINGGVGICISTAGWYTIESQWVENADDPSKVDRNTFVYDSEGNLLYSVYHLTQVSLADAGGNRYGWFLDPNGPDWPPIDSPLPIDNSQLTQLVSPTGKATFGFVSKYKRGASEPTGNTEFVFKAADLNFHSSSYDWLVVNQGGTNAQFKGSGTINGQLAPNSTEYRFMLWAGDGDQDTFRIRIWWEENGTEHVMYDNGSDQPIAGGQIVIHTK